MRSFQSIVEQYQNPNNRYVIRAKISDTETIFVEFIEEPTEQQIIDRVNLYCALTKGNGMKVNIVTQLESPEFPVRIELNGEIISNPTISQLIEVGWRYQVPFDIPVDSYAINKVWSQDTENSNMAVCTCDFILDKDNEHQWQENKSLALKTIENIYVDFLTSDWTTTLKDNNCIPADYTITVDNTDEATNIGLLLQLRNIDRDVYDFNSSEFLRFKTLIVGMGGIMAKVIHHEI